MKNAILPPSGHVRRFIPLFVILITAMLSGRMPAHAGEFYNSLSLQGYTGLLNTPNAEVAEEGTFYALYSNQQESMWRKSIPRQDNYIFSVAMFSILEVGGRLTEAPGKARDLSADFKLKVPFIPRGYYLPSVAFGMQDVGGGSHHLRSKYVVASEELWRFRLSLGYGTGPDRLDGVFGGGEFKAFDWLYLVGDYDTRETNAGIRLVSPEIFGIPAHINITAKTSLDYRPGKVFEFGFGLQFPLGFDHSNRKPLKEKVKVTHREPDESVGVTAKKEIVAARESAPAAEPAGGEVQVEEALRLMKKALVGEGFQNVEVGSGDSLLVVEYENSRYNHNELDGLGVVAGIVAEYAPADLSEIRIVLKKTGIRILQLATPAGELREFLADADRLGKFNESLRITADVEKDRRVRFIGGDGNPSWLRSSLVVYPGLKTFVGTEVGVFDYLLAVKPTLYVNTWKGSVLNARWDIPVSWSDNFDDNRMFRRFRNNSQFERLMLFQTVKLAPTVMVNLGAGMILKDTYGTINEVMWTPGKGIHRFLAKFGYAENNKSESDKKVYLGSYRFYFSPLDTYLVGTGGRFWDQDTGFTVELKRFFGDTAFSVYYKDTRTEDDKHIQVGGVQFSFPLTPRRDMKPYIVQLRGNEEWSYAQETQIVSHGERNFVGTSTGIDPQLPYNLERVFYNRDRLEESYIRKHLLRLRDANMKYNKDRFP
jgi:hypothetical protein